MAYQLTERTIGGFLEYWAEQTPDKEYLVYSDRDLRFTYKQFNERKALLCLFHDFFLL